MADASRISLLLFDAHRAGLIGEAHPSGFGRSQPGAGALRVVHDGPTLGCRGRLAAGVRVASGHDGASLTLLDVGIMTLRGWRGPLSGLIDHPLLARPEYVATRVDVAVGATVVHFECPTLPLPLIGPVSRRAARTRSGPG